MGTSPRTNVKGGDSPPLLWSIASLVLLAATFGFAVVGGPDSNLFGFVSGSLLGTANLAAFLVADNKLRAARRYSDWSISPRKVLPWVALISWGLGVWNAFFWALEMTRP